ncbi:hypothetical protein SteCoe_1729 [Stentor coeruleus]|uniref:CLASP N-terminal domain-containing protein n=1 Tax=Stentor coeruleus TaxID=5963 RepID=A0A1R2D178_9CILI|nr:hypothetical protein SteCoe_1729 [Stentor coeruleus]
MEAFQAQYTSYEDLPVDLKDIQTISIRINSEQWDENFESLTDLRSFLKYNWTELMPILDTLQPRIVQLTGSLRSALAKNALMFLTELLSTQRENLNVPFLLQSLIAKSAFEKAFIKNEVINAIENACRNYPTLDNCEVLLSYTLSKSVGVAKNALKYLEDMTGKLGNEEKFLVMIKLADGKRQEHAGIAKKIMAELEKNWPEYGQRVEGLNDKGRTWVNMLSAQNKQPKIALRDIIKNKKAEATGQNDLFNPLNE